MSDDPVGNARSRMKKSVDATQSEFMTVRTGRANPHMLDRLHVDYYGASTPLNQLANIGAPEPRMLTVTPYDSSIMKEIEKAIAESDLGLTPNSDGNLLRLMVPELNEERRKEIVRIVRNMAEEGRVAVRNVRRDAMTDIKGQQKSGDLSEDNARGLEGTVQKITDENISHIDKALEAKEAEIMEV